MRVFKNRRKQVRQNKFNKMLRDKNKLLRSDRPYGKMQNN